MQKRQGFRISKSVVTGAPMERVRELLADPGTWPSWQPEILRTEGPDQVEVGSLVSGRASMMGFEVDGKNVTTAVERDLISHDAVVGVGMTITYRIEQKADGVKVTHALTSELPRGPLGRLLSLFLRRRLRKMQREVLEGLVAHAEEPSA